MFIRNINFFGNVTKIVKVFKIKNKFKVLLRNIQDASIRIQCANLLHKRNFSSKEPDNKYNRHIYDEKLESLINEQINIEFSAGYIYLSIAQYYGRSNVALPGGYGFFMKMFYEEQQHAVDFIKYQNLRGGIVRLQAISAPSCTEFPNMACAMFVALNMEKEVKTRLLKVYKRADEVFDTNVMDTLDPFILQQEKSIFEISRLYTRAQQLVCTGVGLHIFDKELHESFVKENPGSCQVEVGSKVYF